MTPLRRALAAALSLVLAFALPAGNVLSTEAPATAAPSTPALDEALITEVLEILEQRYVGQDALTMENLTAGAIRGMLDALGDEGHTEYLTPEERAAAEDALDGRVLGIGVVLDQRSGAPLVISVIDGSPADRAGMRSGDVIASIDGVEAVRLPMDELVALVRGEAGTHVRIEVERPGTAERVGLDIVREDVVIDPADWALVPGGAVAIVRIVQFSDGTGEQTRAAVEAALDADARGLVLDLRGDPGGLVHEALEVAALFLDGGVAYQERGRDGRARPVRVPEGRAIAVDIPLIVLVDYATASSAEILAAALRDNGRAAIVGEQTFGTGTVLNTFDLSDGSAVRVGVLEWLTPSGEPVYRVGITPDHVVQAAPGAVALRPADLTGMTAQRFAASDDLPLRRAVGLIEPLASR
jgi:carboxyl-terminal processing protease